MSDMNKINASALKIGLAIHNISCAVAETDVDHRVRNKLKEIEREVLSIIDIAKEINDGKDVD